MAAIGLTVLWGTAPIASLASEDATPERMIVLTDAGAGLDRALSTARTSFSVRPERTFRTATHGFSTRLTPRQRQILAARPDVRAIVPDRPVELVAQSIPQTIKRVGAHLSPIAAINGDGGNVDADIAIIDTGIDPNHPDLNVVGGVDCSQGDGSSWADAAGHGTHVAGTAAARDNTIGVVGVAPGARLWSVRVFNAQSESYFSWIMCGIEWVASATDPGDPQRPLIEAANMSFRGAGWNDGRCGRTNHDPVHQAICAAVDAGVTMIAAAGNDSNAVKQWIPAAYDEVITVSAIADSDGKGGGTGGSICGRQDDAFADFSNFGPEVDIAAPGVCVMSTLRNNRYGTSTGTSMAAPAVTGGAALYKVANPTATPAQVRAALIAAGTMDWRTGTDPDGIHEPVLDVSSFTIAPSFEMTAGPASVLRDAGATATYTISVARLEGYADPIQLTVTGLPDGASGSFEPATLTGAQAGSTLTISLPSSGSYGTYPLTISATSGSQVVTRAVDLQFSASIDGKGPRALFRSGAQLGPYYIPMRVGWNAVPNAQAYQLQQSRAEGPWVDVELDTPLSTSANATGWPNRLMRYRVRARIGGTWQSWSAGPAVTPEVVHEQGYGIVYHGKWKLVQANDMYGGRALRSRTKGDRAVYTFTGKRFAWIGMKSPNHGTAAIRIDGVKVAHLDLSAPSRQGKRIIYASPPLGPGTHKIEVRNRSNGSDNRVDLDALITLQIE